MHVPIHSTRKIFPWQIPLEPKVTKSRLNELLTLWQNVECNLNQSESIITNYFIRKFQTRLTFLIDMIVNNKQWCNNQWYQHLLTTKKCGFTFVTYVWLFFQTELDDSALDLQLDNNISFNNVYCERKLYTKNNRFAFIQLKQFLLQLKCVIGARETMHQLLFNKQICDLADIRELINLIKQLPDYQAPLPIINTSENSKVFCPEIICYIAKFINDYSSLLAWITISRRWYQYLMNVYFVINAPLLRYENVTDSMMLKYNNKISNDFLLRGTLSLWVHASYRSNELTGRTFALERPLLIAYSGSLWLLTYFPQSLKQIRYIYDSNQDNLNEIYHCHKWLGVYSVACKRQLLFFSVENNTTNHFPFPIPAVTVLFFKSTVKINCLASLISVKHSKFWILQDVKFDNDVDMSDLHYCKIFRGLVSSKKCANKEIYILDNIKHDSKQWTRLKNCLQFANIWYYVIKITIVMTIDNADYISFGNLLHFLVNKKGAFCDIMLLFECDKHTKSLCNHLHLQNSIQTWLQQDLVIIRNNQCIKNLWVGLYLVYSGFETGDAVNLKKQGEIGHLFTQLTVEECDTQGLIRVQKLWELITQTLFK